MQRPWGSTRLHVLVEQPGGLCVRSKVSVGERGRRGGQGGDGVGRAWPCGPQEDLGFYFEGGGSPEGLWAEEGRTQVFTGAPWRLLRRGTRTGDEDQRQDGGCGEVRSGWSRDSKGLCPQSYQVTLKPLPLAVKNQPESQPLLSFSAVGWASVSQHSFLPIRSLPPTPVPRPIPALSSVEI